MAGEGDLKLLGTAVSPFTVHVRMALHLKGVSYEYLEQDLFNKSQLILDSNPVHKKVPVLIHDGKPICESLAVVHYVDEVRATATSILPADPYDRAAARFWAAYTNDKLFPAYVSIIGAAPEEERAEKVDEILAEIEQLEEAFARCSNGKAFFAGDSAGYLDLAVGCNLFWLEALREMFGVTVIDAGKAPLLAAWAERFGENEAANEVVPPVGSAVEYIKKLQVIGLLPVPLPSKQLTGASFSIETDVWNTGLSNENSIIRWAGIRIGSQIQTIGCGRPRKYFSHIIKNIVLKYV